MQIRMHVSAWRSGRISSCSVKKGRSEGPDIGTWENGSLPLASCLFFPSCINIILRPGKPGTRQKIARLAGYRSNKDDKSDKGKAGVEHKYKKELGE